MPRPVVSSFTELFYNRLGPWARADTARGLAEDKWELLEFCEACVQGMQPLEDVIMDSGTHVGWGRVMDADAAPIAWLGWLAQFAGVRLLPGLAEAEQRARIKSTDGFKRGSVGGIVGAAQQYLTGAKTVYLIERHGSAYRTTLATKTSETPDLAAVTQAVMAQKPAGIVMVFQTVTGGDYNSLRDTHQSYDEVIDLYADYAEVLSNPTKRP